MLFVTSLMVAVVPGLWRWWWSRRFLAAPEAPSRRSAGSRTPRGAGIRSTPDGLFVGWVGSHVVFVDPQQGEWLEPATDTSWLNYGEWTSARPAAGVLQRNEIVTFLRR
jgi:hypothetical protein